MKTLEERNAENYQLGLPREFSDIPEGVKEKEDQLMVEVNNFLNDPANNKEPHEMGDTHEYIQGGLTRSKEKDDGVCDGEYVHPTQGEIIAFNRGENQGILRSMELLEKLKDFYYWKEWKN